jgi:hypothetical protein
VVAVGVSVLSAAALAFLFLPPIHSLDVARGIPPAELFSAVDRGFLEARAVPG